MTIKTRIIIFFMLLIFISPGIYFYGIFYTFNLYPYELNLYDHIEGFNALRNKTADPKYTLTILLAALVPLLAFARPKGAKGEHGSAKFATRSIIKKMKLFEKKGVILGKFGSDILKYKEKVATLVLAPPGEGKTTGIAIPNLLTFNESALVLDIKSELYELTHKHRENIFGSKIYNFNPGVYDSMCFNPLDENILKDLKWYEKENIVDQVSFLIYPEKEHYDHWINEGRSIFTMFALYSVYQHGHSSIPDIRELIISNFMDLYEEEYNFIEETEAFLHFIKEEIGHNEDLPLRIRELATSVLRKESKELSSVISSCTAPLNIFSTSTVRECFRTNDLHILNFRKEVSTLYITVSEDDLKRLEVPIRLFLEFNLRIYLSTTPDKNDLDMLGILDEFPRYGKNEYLINSPELGRSYKFISLLIAQDYGQIEQVYGKSQISRINTSTAYKVIFPQSNAETAEMTSKVIGDFTRETVSESKSAGDKGNTNKSLSTQLSGQALISKQDILNMNDGQVYILAKNYYKNPIKAKPYLYFNDKKLNKLVTKGE